MRSLWLGLLAYALVGCEKKDQSQVQPATSAKPVPSGQNDAAATMPAPATGRHLSEPLRVQPLGLTLTDKIDVGDTGSEGAHQYVIDGQTWAGVQPFEEPGKQTYAENGRAHKSFESFRVKVTPGKDHVLVRGYNTFSRDQKLRVSIDGKPAGEWTSPNGPPAYGESSFDIPKDLIQDKREVTVKLEFVSASLDAHSFYYWVYARSATVGIKTPLKANVTGMELLDRVDVGDEADETRHHYAIEDATYLGSNLYEVNQRGAYVENGRANKGFESFQVKTRPNADHLLVKAYDTLSHAQKVRVSVEGKAVGEWSMPKDEAERYGEASFKIPSRFVGTHDSVTIRLDYVSGSMHDVNTFVAWVYATPGH